MPKTMSNDNILAKHLWTEAINTTCYLQNKIYIRPILKKTPYELWKGYTKTSKAYRVYNSRTLTVEESIHVKFNDSKPDKKLIKLNDSLIHLNLDDLQTAYKETCMDDV
ncbi:hypothetical protein CR513_30148, partial [Mucuna pruriens]